MWLFDIKTGLKLNFVLKGEKGRVELGAERAPKTLSPNTAEHSPNNFQIEKTLEETNNNISFLRNFFQNHYLLSGMLNEDNRRLQCKQIYKYFF